MSAFQYTPSAAEQAEVERLKKLWDDAVLAADDAGIRLQQVSGFMNSAAMSNYAYNDRVAAMDAFGNTNAYFKDWRNFMNPIPTTGTGFSLNIDRTAFITYFSNKATAAQNLISKAKKAYEDYQAILDKKANAYIQAAAPAIQAQAAVETAETTKSIAMYVVIGLVVLIIGFIVYKKLKK